MGIETQEGVPGGLVSLSLRADFMETVLEVDTMHNRPILNTRDEPHADRARFRRLHLIVGDANMRVCDRAEGGHHQARARIDLARSGAGDGVG